MKLYYKLACIVLLCNSYAVQTSTTKELIITPILSVKHCRRGIVFDIGFNHGQDTLNYLRMNYCVVAVEANPVLAKLGRDSNIFRPYLASRHLVLVDKLIMEGPSKTVPFFVHLLNDEWSSFHKTDGCRNASYFKSGATKLCDEIQVVSTSCHALIKEFGVPFYLKIDIEGNDRNCLNDLLFQSPTARPKYISVEAGTIQNIHLLFKAGYTMFKVVNQEFQGVLGDSTGPFGDFARDVLTSMKWQSYAEIVGTFKEFEHRHIANHTALYNACTNALKNCWYDFHATTANDFNRRPAQN